MVPLLNMEAAVGDWSDELLIQESLAFYWGQHSLHTERILWQFLPHLVW